MVIFRFKWPLDFIFPEHVFRGLVRQVRRTTWIQCSQVLFCVSVSGGTLMSGDTLAVVGTCGDQRLALGSPWSGFSLLARLAGQPVFQD